MAKHGSTRSSPNIAGLGRMPNFRTRCTRSFGFLSEIGRIAAVCGRLQAQIEAQGASSNNISFEIAKGGLFERFPREGLSDRDALSI